MIDEASLARTLDAVDAAWFDGRTLSSSTRTQVGRWIAARQGLPGAKSDSFAAVADELREGLVVFTGERFTHASARHVLGEEACRVLRRLDVEDDDSVSAALVRADAGLLRSVSLAEHDPRSGGNPGVYCCGKCSVGMWRNLASGGLDRQEERLQRGVGEFLRASRTAGHRWRIVPFWYTVLALSELSSVVPDARAELEHAAPALERTVKRTAPADTVGARRHELARRVLAAV